MAIKDLTGKRFGRLKAIESTELRKGKGSVVWKCLCSIEFGGCGNVCFISSNSLMSGNANSCGCLHIESCTINGLNIGGYNRKSIFDKDGNKLCLECNEFKSEEWFFNRKRNKSGKGSICKECYYFYQAYRDYGITKDDYHKLAARQNYRCPICNFEIDIEYTLDRLNVHIDHSVDENGVPYVRGLLHPACNLNYVSNLNYELAKNVTLYLSKFENEEMVFDAF